MVTEDEYDAVIVATQAHLVVNTALALALGLRTEAVLEAVQLGHAVWRGTDLVATEGGKEFYTLILAVQKIAEEGEYRRARLLDAAGHFQHDSDLYLSETQR